MSGCPCVVLFAQPLPMHAETVKLAMDCLAVLIENVNDQDSLSKNEEITNTIILSLFNLLRNHGLVNASSGGSHGAGSSEANIRINSVTGNFENDSPNNNLRASIFRLIALLSDKNYVYANKIIKRALSYIISTTWDAGDQEKLSLLADFLAVIGTACLVCQGSWTSLESGSRIL